MYVALFHIAALLYYVHQVTVHYIKVGVSLEIAEGVSGSQPDELGSVLVCTSSQEDYKYCCAAQGERSSYVDYRYPNAFPAERAIISLNSLPSSLKREALQMILTYKFPALQ